MKRLLFTGVLAIALLAVGVAYACEEPPKRPVCPAGQIETSPAVWHPATYACPTVSFTASRQVVDVEGYYLYSTKVNEPVWVETTYKCPAEPYTSNEVLACRSRYKSGSGSGHYHYAAKVEDVAGHFEDNYVCPSGYDYHNQSHSDLDCRKWVPDTYKTDTFGPINVVYGDKSSDQNHCHRPTGSSLGVPSWAMSDFNKLPEKKDTIETPGYWDPPTCETPYVQCSKTVPGVAKDTEYGAWSECLAGEQTRSVTTWSVPLLDSKDASICEPSVPTTTTEPQACTGPVLLCEDPKANNQGQPLPCTFPDPVCEDKEANNVGGPLPCTYDEPPVLCEDETALNFGKEGACEYPPPVTPPPPPEKKETCLHKMYEMATFEFPSGKIGYLVSWDGYPANVSRQLCHFGEIAENTPVFEYVIYNSCTGKYTYNDEPWYFYDATLEEPHWHNGACANVGGCGQ